MTVAPMNLRMTTAEYATYKAGLAADVDSEPAGYALATGKAALDDLAASTEIADLINRLRGAQIMTEMDDSWDTPAGSRIESALGYLRMAAESAGVRF